MSLKNYQIVNRYGAVSLRGHVLDLLLLLYVNDMPYAHKCSKITMYADDTSLAYSAKNVNDISKDMNYEL